MMCLLDTELVSTVILNLKRGKAADVDGLMAEHLLFCHLIASVILSKFSRILMITHYIPRGFKCSYIVPIPKMKNFDSRALTRDDFRGIAISPVCLSGTVLSTRNVFSFVSFQGGQQQTTIIASNTTR